MIRSLTRLSLLAAAATVLFPSTRSSPRRCNHRTISARAWPGRRIRSGTTTSTPGRPRVRGLMRSSLIIAFVVVPSRWCRDARRVRAGDDAVRRPGADLPFLMLGLALPYESIVIPLYFDLKPSGCSTPTGR